MVVPLIQMVKAFKNVSKFNMNINIKQKGLMYDILQVGTTSKEDPAEHQNIHQRYSTTILEGVYICVPNCRTIEHKYR